MPLPAYVQLVLSDNPVAFWRMDEGSGDFADATGNGHTAVVTDAQNLTYAQQALLRSLLGDAAPFWAYVDGDDTHPQVTAADHPDFDPTGPFSIEFWFRATRVVEIDQHTICAKLAQKFVAPYPFIQTNGYFVWLNGNAAFLPGGGVKCTIRAQTFQPMAVPGPGNQVDCLTDLLDYDRTYHIVVRRDAADRLDIVVNGVAGTSFAGDFPATFDSTAGSDLQILSYHLTPPAQPGPPNALVSHVAFYDHFLSDDHCLAHYLIGSGGGLTVWMALL